MRFPFGKRGKDSGPGADAHIKVASWLESQDHPQRPEEPAKGDATVIVAPEAIPDIATRLPAITERAEHQPEQQQQNGEGSKNPEQQQQQQQREEKSSKGVACGLTGWQCVGLWALLVLVVALVAAAATLLPVLLSRPPNPPYKGYAELQQRNVVSGPN